VAGLFIPQEVYTAADTKQVYDIEAIYVTPHVLVSFHCSTSHSAYRIPSAAEITMCLTQARTINQRACHVVCYVVCFTVDIHKAGSQ
jgi:hypothetical protein